MHGLGREDDVLGDRHHRDQHEVLVDHADAVLDRGLRRAELGRLAVDQDLALVGPVEAVEDVHQRRLAGAVLAQQRVHLALAQVEVDAVVRDDAGEPLRDPAELENRPLVHPRRSYCAGAAAPSGTNPRRSSGCSRSCRPRSPLDALDLGDGRPGHGRRDHADPDRARGDVEDRVLAAVEAAVDDLLHRLEDGLVHLLQRARGDVLAEVRLVGVDADPAHVLLLRGREGAEPALARDLEDHVGAAGDLVERELLALRLVDEVLRVRVQGRDPRIRLLRARLVARDVAVDGRDLLPADGADHLLRARLVLRDQPGQVADEVAGLLLLEEQAADVLRLRLHVRLRRVDDREVRVGVARGHLLERRRHQEADRDHEVVVLLRERGQVGDVVRVRLRDDDAARDAQLALGAQQALVGEEVERAVVEAADVGDEPDLEPLPARPAAGRRRRRRLGARSSRSPDVSSSPPPQAPSSSRSTSNGSSRASLMREVVPEGAGSKPRPFRGTASA